MSLEKLLSPAAAMTKETLREPSRYKVPLHAQTETLRQLRRELIALDRPFAETVNSAGDLVVTSGTFCATFYKPKETP